MSLLEIVFEEWTIKVYINIIFCFCVGVLVYFISRKYVLRKFKFLSEIVVDEVELGIGTNSNVKLKYDNSDRQIAYKLWVELTTRKIGLKFEDGLDVISEVYDSWYKFFYIARELLKEIPVDKIQEDEKTSLVQVTIQILNKCIRPHLTKWQAKYRKWYTYELENNQKNNISPQEIQKRYEHYDELVAEILEVNKKIEKYSEVLYKISKNK